MSNFAAVECAIPRFATLCGGVSRDRLPLSLSRGRETSRDRSVDDTRRRNENEDARREIERERAYLLSGGRLYSGDNVVVAAGVHRRSGGFTACHELHSTPAYHHRRSWLGERRFKFDLKRCDSQEAGVCERSAQNHDRACSRFDLLSSGNTKLHLFLTSCR